ncbi:MAG: hypothetical protein RJA70_3036 [Pseudomonadota bacterium]
MSTVNPLSREVSAKIVYVGPGLSGKTTSLQYVHSRLNTDRRGQLISLSTEEDRTLFFDFLPVKIPRVNGLGVRLQLYTVPGQVFYAATRELVLKGADGVVFVADSQAARQEANQESLQGVEAHLKEQGANLETFPLIIQYNKQDLHSALPVEELRATLNPRGVPDFATSAVNGEGVVEALRAAVRAVVNSLSPKSTKAPRSHEFGPIARESGIAESLSAASHGPPRFQTLPARASLGPSSFGFGGPGGSLRPEEVDVTGDAAGGADEIVLVDDDADQTQVTTQRPVAGVSFSSLWDQSQRDPIILIESCISAGRHHDAVHHVATCLALLLAQLPVTGDTSMGSRAQMLGLDGHEYMQICWLASQPKESITYKNALFAVYVLVAARVKSTRLLAQG